jgi:small membrane protein
MTSIQALLVTSLFIAAIVASFILKAKLAWRLIALALFLAAIVFVLFPDLTTIVANRLGVGRGTDLLLYVSLIAGLHAILLLYLRTRDLEKRMTEHVRATGLREAQRSACK